MQVERYFINVSQALTSTSNAYIGVESVSGTPYSYYLADGQYAGQGYPFNGDDGIYAHWCAPCLAA